MKSRILLILFCLLIGTACYAQQTITIPYKYVLVRDMVPVIQGILKANKGKKNITISFAKGKYNFYPQPNTNIAFDINDYENLTINGNGSEFIFHGTSRIAVLKNCKNITLENFSVDWQRPFTSQGTIVRVNNKYLDVMIDSAQYPYRIKNNKIYFIGEDWEKPAISDFNNLYDKDTKEIIYNTWDAPLGKIFEQKCTKIGKNTVRFYGHTDISPTPGSLVTIYTDRHPDQTGIYASESKNITFRNLRLYYTLNIGFLAQHCENITFDNAFCAVYESKGRIFSSESDNAHFNNCKGLVKLTNCSPTGMGDDAINVHGRYFEIQRIISPKEIEIKLQDVRLKSNEGVWFIDGNTSRRVWSSLIASQQEGTYNGTFTPCLITFNQDIPNTIKPGDYLESKEWTPSVEIVNCHFAKKNRARGVLVTTDKKVLVKDNYFNTAGCAILLESGINHWNESGECNDVTITGNTFHNCLTSGNAHDNPGEWGDAIITINPTVMEGDSAFHKNITISNNTFDVFDAPIVSAKYVDNLKFINNRINYTRNYKPYAWQKNAFSITKCRNITISSNEWINYPAQDKKIQLYATDRKELLERDEEFDVISNK